MAEEVKLDRAELHKEIGDFLQGLADKYGIAIIGIDAGWIDICTHAEVGRHLIHRVQTVVYSYPDSSYRAEGDDNVQMGEDRGRDTGQS